MKTGRIYKALSGFYYVDCDGETVTCRARGKFRKDGITPIVGDIVAITALSGGEGVVEHITERRNFFTRPVVANIDQLVIVASNAIPKSDFYLIDRMTAVSALKDCAVLICINKTDLDTADELYRYYSAAGFPTLRVSAATGDGIDRLRASLAGKLSAFAGDSGVGKSSLLNALLPELSLPVGEVSRALGRGRHTTRHVELYRLGDAQLIDTPGFAAFDTSELRYALWRSLPDTFLEFAPYVGDCRFTSCSHTSEPDCAVRTALQAGQIVAGRYESYCRLHEELRDCRDWQEKKETT